MIKNIWYQCVCEECKQPNWLTRHKQYSTIDGFKCWSCKKEELFSQKWATSYIPTGQFQPDGASQQEK